MARNQPSVVCDAIRKKRLLQFTYQGKLRIVAPYCHGVSTRGVEVLRAVQVGGESRLGGLGFGKLWVLADMVDAQITSKTFIPDDPNYNPDDSAMTQVHCRI
jgi:hypothetical protein